MIAAMDTSPQPRPQARPAPAWLTRSVMYQIHLRSFTPEGTLAAATARLGALAGLGVDVLYLTPICLQDDDPRQEFWSERQRRSPFRNPRNPYRIKDYFAIDPEYGTPADLRALVAEAHRLGLRVMLDVVFFHCGPTAVFLDRHPDFVKRGPDGAFATGGWGFPVLDFANPALREYLLGNLAFWLREYDVDGFRYDVSDAIPLDFWESARERLVRLKPETVILGEGQRPDDQLAAMHLNYNFSWSFAIHRLFNQDAPAHLLRSLWLTMQAERPDGARFIRYIDNHDIAHDTGQGLERQPGQSDARWAEIVAFHGLPAAGLPPDSRPDRIWGADAVDALLTLCFAMDGMPFLYNGQEVADTAPHSIYGRLPVDWSRGDTEIGRRRFAHCRRLCALRHREPALGDGALTWLDHDRPDEALAFMRTAGDRRLLALVNLKPRAIRVRLPAPWAPGAALRPLVEAGMAEDPGDPGVFVLAPFAYLVAATA